MKSLISALIPKRCLNCSRYGLNICEVCFKSLTPILPECYICRRVSTEYLVHTNCINRAKDNNETVLHKVTYLWRYEQIVSEIMSAAKYAFAYQVLFDLMMHVTKYLRNSVIAEELKSKILIPVPQHKRKQNLRGFDHTQIIAGELARVFNLQIASTAVAKTRDNRRQAEVDRESRHTNIKGVYSLSDSIADTIPQKANILLVDDVMTTGSTLIECAKTIKEKRPDIVISGLTLFRGRAYYHDKDSVHNPAASLIKVSQPKLKQ